MALAILVVLLPGSAGAQSSGMAFKEDTVFTVEDDAVLVESTFVVTNTTSDRRQGNTVYYTYFDHIVVPIPAGAVDFTAVSRGRSITTTSSADAEEIDEFDMVSLVFPSDLRSGRSREILVSYRLPPGGPRGNTLFTTNPAFFGFPIWSSSDPGTGSVAVKVPRHTDFESFGDRMHVGSTDADYFTWVPSDFSTPVDWFSYVTVRDDAALEEHRFKASEQTIVLESWPNDDEWVEFATDTISVGLPALENLIGRSVPDQETLEITESVTPYFYGYGGWYSPLDTSIEVGNELDESVMLHELSHAWFNDSLFSERWIAEGLAEEFTWRAQQKLDFDPMAEPERPRRSAPGSQPLVNWTSAFQSGRDGFEAQEEWGYNAAWWVVHESTEIVGLEAVRAAIGAATDRTIPYTGQGEPEAFAGAYDWKRLLDLLSENSTDPAADDALVELFEDYVVEAADGSDLADRRAARILLAEFRARELDWATPLAVREAMSHWRFDDASEAIVAASAVQDEYLDVQAAATDHNLETSGAVRALYESEDHDLESAAELMAEQLAAIDRVVELRSEASQERPFVQSWGLGDTDLSPYFDRAATAFAEDRFDDIDAEAAALEAALADATARGESYVAMSAGGAAAALVLFLAAALTLRRRRRRRRAALVALARAEAPTPGLPVPVDSYVGRPEQPIAAHVFRPADRSTGESRSQLPVSATDH